MDRQLTNEVVLLPSEPEEFGSEEALVSEIQTFIHRYVDVSPLFAKIAGYYVLLTWIYLTCLLLLLGGKLNAILRRERARMHEGTPPASASAAPAG